MASAARKINILELHSSLGSAGGQRNMITFASYLDATFFNVFVGSYREGGAYETRLRSMGIEPIVSMGEATPIIKFVQEHEIDVLHIHRSGHHVSLETEIIEGAKRVRPSLIIVEKNVFGKYDSVSGQYIDCSFFQSMMHVHERFLPAAKTTFDFASMKVMYNMVDTIDFEQYRMADDEIAAYRESLGIEPHQRVIGKIGRPHLSKWSDLILEMMPALLREVPNTVLLVQSLPPSRKKRVKRAPWGHRVIDLPQTSDQQAVHRFYQTIDVLAHSSKIGECNGNTINEAHFWKKPVVVNSTPQRDNGQLEQVIHGENGYVANTPRTFARAIARLLNDTAERTRLGEAGHTRVCTVNDPSHITAMLEKRIVEQMQMNGESLPSALSEKVVDVEYTPSEKDILSYRTAYKERCQTLFERNQIRDSLETLMHLPVRLYWKVHDYLGARRT